MTTATGVVADCVRVRVGDGSLLRREKALLFVQGRDPARIDALVAAFLAADPSATIDAITDAVTDAVTDAGFDTAPFTVIAWDSQLHVVVFGALDVRTDHPSLPMLSGAGSATWVERRVRPGAETVTIEVSTTEAGAAVDPASDLRLGRVAAGGFAATFHTAATFDTDAAPPTIPPKVPAPATPSTPAGPAPTAPDPVADPTGPVSGDRLAALRAAMRVHDTSGGSVEAEIAPLPDPIDDEVTLAPDDNGATSDAIDAPDDGTPLVQAVRCPRGHVNPIHVSVCQTCGDLMEIGAPTETIRQPPLAMLELPTAETIAVDRAIVLGRRPDHEAAQADDRAQLVVVTDDPSVSRTHVRIDVEDWSLTVTDCGSRSGTAIVVRPGEEPRILEPWITHELPVGARLFLGGPTSVVIRAIPSRRSGRG